MKPVKFVGHNTVFATAQPPYLPLPAHRGINGLVTTCWKLTPLDRLKLLFTGVVWFQQLTFFDPLQPQRASTKRPILEEPG